MHYLNGSYVGYFNARHGRMGHLFQGRFKSVLVEEEGYWREVSRYIHLNPVRAGLAERPEDWGWCSYRGYHRPHQRVRWVDYQPVLNDFGGDDGAGRKAYRDFVAEGLGRKLDSPLSQAIHGMVLGSEKFLERVRELIEGKPEAREIPELDRLRRRPSLEEVVAAVCRYFGTDPARWRNNTRCDDLSRAAAAYIARQATGLPAKILAEGLGYRNVSSISASCRRMEQAMKSDRMGKDIQALTEQLTTNH